jgi:hypothetical protein
VIDLKNLNLLEHIFMYFRVSFHDLLLKIWPQQFLSKFGGTPVIIAHWSTEEACGEYSSDRRK